MNKIWKPIYGWPIIALLMLSGCTEIGVATTYAENKGIQAVENAKRINDAEARFVLTTPCAMSIGAYHRVLNDVEKRAVDWLCEGDMITGDDVQFLKDYIELLERSRDAVNDGVPE